MEDSVEYDSQRGVISTSAPWKQRPELDDVINCRSSEAQWQKSSIDTLRGFQDRAVLPDSIQ